MFETSTVITLAEAKIPATAASAPEAMYTANSSPRRFTPARRAARGSMPIASIISPSALRRTSSPTAMTMRTARRNTTGRPST